MSLNNVFNTPEKTKRTPMSAAGYILGIVVFYPLIFVGVAWLITIGVTQIVEHGVSFWPIMFLLIAAFFVLSWVGKAK